MRKSLDIKEDHNSRHKWHPEPGDVNEGLAAIGRISPVQPKTNMQRRTEAQRAIVRAKSALNTIHAWMETAINISDEHLSVIEQLERSAISAAQWVEHGRAKKEAVLPVLPKGAGEEAIPDFITRRNERRQVLEADLAREQWPIVGRPVPTQVRGVSSH
jgi:hypothetical protein